MSVFDVYLEREDWQVRAACRGMAPVDGSKGHHPFFPDNKHVADTVVELCRGCPVRSECEDAGVDQVGVWGGKSQRARERGGTPPLLPERVLRRRRVHRLSAQGETGERIGLAVGTTRRNVVRILQAPCGDAACWCAERGEVAG